jgi:hypothetical protein
MTIFTQDGYDPGDDPASVPLIGYDNKISNITASSEDTDFPATNLLNPATHLFWQAEDESAQALGIMLSGESDYLAIARHNFLDSGATISLLQSPNLDATSGYLMLLMHFEGTNGSTDFFDSSGNDVGFGFSGTVSISTSQFKFGASSASFGGGYIYCGGSLTFAFGTDDFTVDCWVRINATGAIYTIVDCGASTTGFSIRKNASDFLVFRTGNTDRITGATALTTGTWHHVAVARSGTSTKIFLNGAQQGSTYTDSNDYVPVSLARIGINQTSTEALSGFIDELRVLSGSAAWTAAFTPSTSAYQDGLTATFGNYALLFHFDGTDASAIITDSGGADHVFTAQGNAQLDTAQFKFGTASLLLDGTGDYLQGDGSDDFAFSSNDFTIDFWIRFNTTGAEVMIYDNRPAGVATGAYITIYRSSLDKIILSVDGADRITGTTSMTGATWHHIALTRSGTSTRLFLNGTQEGSTYTDSNVYLNPPSRPVIGIDGNILISAVNGWIDELRVIKGTALWTSSFAPPQRAAGTQAVIGKAVTIENAFPVIFRFTPTTDSFLLRINAASESAQIAVIYAGELLVLERGVKVDVQHSDIVHARRSSVLAGMSESGNFLGRILLSEWRESIAEFAWFTPDWYRTNFEPFVVSAMTDPFFWVWNPDEYPDETAFAWIIEDIVPETDPATRRIAATISMRAIV